MKQLLIYTAMVFCAAITIAAINFMLLTGEEKTEKWISEHQKPIVCKFNKQSLLAEKSYTLIDANGKIYSTGFVELTLPDTLK